MKATVFNATIYEQFRVGKIIHCKSTISAINVGSLMQFTYTSYISSVYLVQDQLRIHMQYTTPKTQDIKKQHPSPFCFQVDGGALEVILDVHITLSRPFVCHLLLGLQKTDVIFIRVVEVLFNWAVFQRSFIINFGISLCKQRLFRTADIIHSQVTENYF